MNIGWFNGCFDLFHDGHRFAIRECQRQCDWLLLGVNTDASIVRLKGPERPIDSLEVRMRNIRHFVRQHKTPISIIPFEGNIDPLLMNIRPDTMFVGYDHIAPTASVYRWTKIIQLDNLPGFSTTAQLRKR